MTWAHRQTISLNVACSTLRCAYACVICLNDEYGMRNLFFICLALLAAAVFSMAFTAAKKPPTEEPVQPSAKPQTREPKVSFAEAVKLAEKEIKGRNVYKDYFIRRASYEVTGNVPPRWVFTLSPKDLMAPKVEPVFQIEMNGSMTIIKGR